MIMFWESLKAYGGWQLSFSVLSGLLVALILFAIPFIGNIFTHRKLKKIFGTDFSKSGEYSMVFSQFQLKPIFDRKGTPVLWPFIKNPERPLVDFKIRFSDAASSTELRATQYLTHLLGKFQLERINIVSDEEAFKGIDRSFVSFGGANYKSAETQENSANIFLRFADHGNGFQCFQSIQYTDWAFTPDEKGFDYGLILRITPKSFPSRTWIACIGFGEWGSSGAAYFLANKWRELLGTKKPMKRRRNKNGDFAAIIKVKIEQDETAELLDLFTTPEQTEKSAIMNVIPDAITTNTTRNNETTTTLAPSGSYTGSSST